MVRSVRRIALTLFAGLLAVLAAKTVRAQSQILIRAGTVWSYNDSGVDLGTEWRSLSYVDTGWPLGSAPLGYGNGDETTVVSYGGDPNNKHIATYFRHSFTVPNPASIPALTLRFIRDDGVVLYLNGVEITRSNMPAGAVNASTLASGDVTGANEVMWQQVAVDRTLLVQGTNVIAAEIHQGSAVSDDLRFDLSLYASAALPAPPKVTLVSPIDHDVTNSANETLAGQAASSSELVSATLYAGSAAGTVTLSGPEQVEDAQITADSPSTPNGFGGFINIDGQGPHVHGLMKFPALIGSGANQVPAGSIVTSATLQVNCTAGGNAMLFYRLTQDWADEQATWNQRLAGTNWTNPGADGSGSNAGVGLNAPCANAGVQTYDLTRFVQEWSDGAPNYGFVITDTGTSGVDFTSSESGLGPVLTVSYRPFQNPVASQNLSGFNAAFNFPVTLTLGQTLWWNVLVTDTSGQQSWAPANFSVSLDPGGPNRPVLVSPLNGAVNVPPSAALQAQISDPAGGVLNATASVRPAASEFTMVVFGDTQFYSQLYPAIYAAQTQWIVDNKTARNIVFVSHVGDIVEYLNVTSEWQAAKAAMSKLDGVVPYGIAPGDNEQPTANYNTYFPYQNYEGLPWYGGHYQNLNDNHYELFSAGGMNFVIVHLAFCPGTGALTWADSIFKTYPNRIGMFTTHGYLGVTAQRNVEQCGSTQYIWDRLAVPNPNLHFMFAGHEHDEARRSDIANGHPVHQLLADFQDRPSGGNGWLRVLRFVPAENRVYVQTYSPWLNQYETDANSQFTLDFPMGGAATTVAAAGASGSTVSFNPSGLQPFKEYEWQITVTNGSGKQRQGPVWRFTTGAADPPPPPPPPPAGVVAQSVSASANGTGTSIAITHGLNIQPNDVILAFVHVNGNQRVTDNNGANAFTEVIDQAGPDSNGHAIYSRIAGASEPAAYQWTRAGSDRWSVAIRVFKNVNTANIWDVAPSASTRASGNSATATAPSITINTAGAMGLVFVFSDATAQSFNNPTNGYGVELEVTGHPQATYVRTWAAVGATGPVSVSQVTNDWMAYQIALRPAPVPGTDTAPPLRSNGQPSGALPAGTTLTTISLTTDEPATCRYSATPNTDYASMPDTFTTTGGTLHSTSINGLADNTTYNRYVRCADGSNNPNTNDFTITFSVAAAAPNSAPAATGVNVTGTPGVGQLLTGHYTYGDVDGDLEGVSTFRWLRDGAAIGGATGISYTVAAAESGHSIRFEVTPVAATGTPTGIAVSSPDLPIAGNPPPSVNVIESGRASANGIGTSISITHGLNIQANDVVLVFVHVNGNQRVTDNNGGNAFAENIDQAGPDTNGHAIYSRIAGAAEPATYQWTRAGTDRWSVAIRVFRNVNTANIWDVAPAAATRSSGNGSTAIAPSITINTAGAMGIVFVFSDVTPQSFSNPTNSYGGELEVTGQPQATYIRTWAAAGATGPASVSQSSNDWMAYQIALRAAP